MEKYVGNVKVDIDTGKVFVGDLEIERPWHVAQAYKTYCTYEYLEENYSNDKDTLWKVAYEVWDMCLDIDLNELELIEEACRTLHVTLIEK